MHQPFSEWRFAHHHFIHLPRTISAAEPQWKGDGWQMRNDWYEAAHEHAEAFAALPDNSGAYCADAARCFWLGA